MFLATNVGIYTIYFVQFPWPLLTIICILTLYFHLLFSSQGIYSVSFLDHILLFHRECPTVLKFSSGRGGAGLIGWFAGWGGEPIPDVKDNKGYLETFLSAICFYSLDLLVFTELEVVSPPLVCVYSTTLIVLTADNLYDFLFSLKHYRSVKWDSWSECTLTYNEFSFNYLHDFL